MKRFRLLLMILCVSFIFLGFVACNESDDLSSVSKLNTDTVSKTVAGGGDDGGDLGPSPVPEPATLILLGSGLVGLAGIGRKKFFKKDK